jgi:hypothetical protein
MIQLVSVDSSSDDPIAYLDMNQENGQPYILHITLEGKPILEDILVTLVYAYQVRDKEIRRSTSRTETIR